MARVYAGAGSGTARERVHRAALELGLASPPQPTTVRIDRRRIAAAAGVTNPTVRVVYEGGGSVHSRTLVIRAALDLGLPRPPERMAAHLLQRMIARETRSAAE